MKAMMLGTNGKYAVTEIEKGLAGLRAAVGGEPEGMTFTGHTDMIMFVNEMGKIHDLKANCPASMLCFEYSGSIDIICGNAVICGMDEEGSSCDLTDDRIRMITEFFCLYNIRNEERS